MRPTYIALAAVTLAAGACPAPAPFTSTGGLAVGSTGGTATDALRFSVQPSDGTAGQVLTPAIQVEVTDSLGAPDTAFTGAVSVAIGTNLTGARLSGTTSATPVNGIAQFGDLSIDKAGSGYTLRASAPGATSVTSATFTVLAP